MSPTRITPPSSTPDHTPPVLRHLAAALVLGAGLAFPATAAVATAAGPFSAEVAPDADTGWKILVLRHNDPKHPEAALEARVAPEAGGNLFSLKVGEDELLNQAAKLADVAQHRGGVPILFPTPNRVRGGKMTFEGRAFTFEPNNQGNFIHGLARTRAWQAQPPTATGSAATAVIFLDWNDSQPDFARFPIKHRLTVTFTLRKTGLRIAYEVHNQDRSRLPFGFGLHPWFRLPGDRKDVLIQVPAAQRMEAEGNLPSGKLVDVAGTPYDLRKPTPVAGLNLDDVYFGVTPARPPTFELRDRGLRVTLGGSPEFTHAVVFTPPDRPVFCIENQTSSTDAHNLHAQGKKREAHLQVVAPGGKARGFVDWKITRLPK